MTVNQCYDVLLRWTETRDWEDSIRHVMPKRKLKGGQGAESVDAECGENDAGSSNDIAYNEQSNLE